MNKYIKIWILLLLSPMVLGLISLYLDKWNNILEFLGVMSVFVWIPLWLISLGLWISYSCSKDKNQGLVVQPIYKESSRIQDGIFIWLPIMIGTWLYFLYSPSLRFLIKPSDVILIKFFFIWIPLLIILATIYSYIKGKREGILEPPTHGAFETIDNKETPSFGNDFLEVEKEVFGEFLKEGNLQKYKEVLMETKQLYTDWIKDEQSEKRKEEMKVVISYIDEECKKYNLVQE